MSECSALHPNEDMDDEAGGFPGFGSDGFIDSSTASDPEAVLAHLDSVLTFAPGMEEAAMAAAGGVDDEVGRS